MEITAIPNNAAYVNNVKQVGTVSETTGTNSTEPSQTEPKDLTTQVSSQQAKREADKKDLEKHTEQMNQIMEALSTDLKFALHEKTQRLMVRLVDTRDNKVLKEFPPHEFLDTIARIRDYVGVLLDKKV